MPTIISSTKLRNEYNEVSRQCHERPEAIFVTKNGMGDLAVMSMEAYETLVRRADLLRTLELGHEDVAAGRTVPAADVLAELRAEFA